MNIATTVCLEQDESEDSIYPSVGHRDIKQRRIIYWKCVVAFFASSIRCNPNAKHILFTNDTLPLVEKGVDIRQFLTDIGVEIRVHTFQHFKVPLGYSKRFLLAFYKLDALKQLSLEEEGHSMVLDSDCVWIRHNQEFFQTIENNNSLLLYDVFERKDPYKITSALSRHEIGVTYRKVDPQYPNPFPIQFAGEIVAGNNRNLKVVVDEMQEVFNYIVNTFKETPPEFISTENMLDGDEYISGYVYNKMAIPWINAKQYIRRIKTWPMQSRALESDLDLTVWHVPFEKREGFVRLYDKIIRKKSAFWTTPLDEFGRYQGKFLGIPKRSVPYDFFLRTKNKVVAMTYSATQKMNRLAKR